MSDKDYLILLVGLLCFFLNGILFGKSRGGYNGPRPKGMMRGPSTPPPPPKNPDPKVR